MIEHMLQKLPDGNFMYWGRHATVDAKRGVGSPVHYSGEVAEVVRLLIKHSK